MGKITFMGAGSAVFAKNVIGDSLLSPALRDFEFALYDIDAARLEDSYLMICALNKNINEGRAKITKYLGVENRKDALRGADFVINAIQVGLYKPCTVTDFEVPKKYGLRQTIADTLGIGGIFRALRTIPVLEDFAEDMAERKIPMTMEDWATHLDDILSMSRYELLTHSGKVSAKLAEEHALTEFQKYRIIQDRLYQSDFDRFVLEENEDEGTAAGMLHKYANPDLISSEKNAWRKAADEKHGQA